MNIENLTEYELSPNSCPKEHPLRTNAIPTKASNENASINGLRLPNDDSQRSLSLPSIGCVRNPIRGLRKYTNEYALKKPMKTYVNYMLKNVIEIKYLTFLILSF